MKNIREILAKFGPSKEMKQRLSNGQIKVNNEVVRSFDVEVNILLPETADIFGQGPDKIVELAEFLMESGIDLQQLDGLRKAAGLDIKDFFGTQSKDNITNIDKFKFLSHFVLVSISKKEHYVFVNLDNQDQA